MAQPPSSVRYHPEQDPSFGVEPIQETPRQKGMRLAAGIRDKALRADMTAREAIEMLKAHETEEIRRLVEADGDDMLRVQGGIRLLQKIIRELTTTPPTHRSKI